MRPTQDPSGKFELALRVDERRFGEFFWVLLSARTDGILPDHERQPDNPEALYYRPYRSATEPQDLYWNALLLGMAELRRVLSGR
jgi:hypothetical protein